MNWLTEFVRPKIRTLFARRDVPDNLWDQCPACEQMTFHRDLIANGIAEGFAVVSSLKCDEATVATVLGIRQQKTFVFLRISNAGRRWSHCSPSRLIVERTMAALHQDGVRTFDLSVGNYAFKRRFGAVPLPLTDVSIALGWRGMPYALRDHSAQRLRRYPWLAERVGRALGKLSRDEDI